MNRGFSKKELLDILDITQFAILCRNGEDVEHLIRKIKNLLGGDYFVYGIGQGNMYGLSSPPLIIRGTYPEDWLKIYGQLEYYYIDPIVLRTFNNPGDQIWEETFRLYQDTPTDFISQARDFRLCHGVSGGFYDQSTGFATIFSLAGKGNWFSGHQKDLCSIVSPYFHQALMRAKNYLKPLHILPLTQREKQVLQWLKDGKTLWEVGSILNISERTAKFHLDSVKTKLNASNKSHAIAMACDLGLI